jgi:hypothetical protein
LSCFLLDLMCFAHVSLLSTCMPMLSLYFSGVDQHRFKPFSRESTEFTTYKCV